MPPWSRPLKETDVTGSECALIVLTALATRMSQILTVSSNDPVASSVFDLRTQEKTRDSRFGRPPPASLSLSLSLSHETAVDRLASTRAFDGFNPAQKT